MPDCFVVLRRGNTVQRQGFAVTVGVDDLELTPWQFESADHRHRAAQRVSAVLVQQVAGVAPSHCHPMTVAHHEHQDMHLPLAHC